MTEQAPVDLLHASSGGYAEPILQPRLCIVNKIYYMNLLRIYSDWLYRILNENLLGLMKEMGSASHPDLIPA